MKPVAVALILSACSLVHGSDWPQWRGPARDGHGELTSQQKIETGAPKLDWKVPAGPGFSSPILAGDSVVFCGGDGDKEAVFCLNAADGKQRWKATLSNLFQDEWGAGTRATPIIDGDKVYAQSCDGEFQCLNLKTGAVIWRKNFDADFGMKFLGSKAREGTASRRGNNGSPVIAGDAVLIPVGNPDGATVVALDKLTGRTLWKAGEDEAAYSALTVATLAGTKQVVAFTADALVGMDRANGKLLWRVPLRTNAKRHAATPLIWDDNIVVQSHTLGMRCFQIARRGNGFEAKERWTNPTAKVNLATGVLVKNHLYTHGPSRDFICVDANTGQLKWAAPGFGKEYSATIALADKLAVLTDEGQLVWIAADPAAYRELGRHQVAGKNWNHPAFANGKLYIRDQRELARYDVLAK